MGGSSNLVYPEVPLQQYGSTTSVHFPGERRWGLARGGGPLADRLEAKSHERASSPQEQS